MIDGKKATIEILETTVKNNEDRNKIDFQEIELLKEKYKNLLKAINQKDLINSKIVDKLKKEYEKLVKVIIDENIQVELLDKIENNYNETLSNFQKINNRINNYVNIQEFSELVNDNDYSLAFKKALEKCYNENKILKIPNGTYYISEQITLSDTKSSYVIGDGNAIIIAKTEMDNMIYKGYTWGVKGGRIEGIILNCNRLAKNGIFLECYNKMEIVSNKILNFLETGIKMMDTNQINGSARTYENIIEKNYIRGLTQNEYNGLDENNLPNYGILLNSTSTDNIIDNNIIINTKLAGIKVGEGNNILSFNHFYAYPESYAPNYFIEAMGQCSIQNNYFDSSKICIKIDYHDVSITNNLFFWQTNSSYDRTENGCILLNNQWHNDRINISNNRCCYKGNSLIGFDIKVVNQITDDSFISDNTFPLNKFVESYQQFIMRKDKRYRNFQDIILNLFNGNIKRWSIERSNDNDSHFEIYSYTDEGTKVEQFKINRLTGAITIMQGNFSLNKAGSKIYLRGEDNLTTSLYALNGKLIFTPLSGETSERPSPSTLPRGTMYFDNTLGYPLFARGGVWVDSIGNIVE